MFLIDPRIREYLEKTAPLKNSEKIRKPVYAVVGKNDPRVPWTESRQMLDKLKNNGIQTWFLMANDEGHGYAKRRTRIFFSTRPFCLCNSSCWASRMGQVGLSKKRCLG